MHPLEEFVQDEEIQKHMMQMVERSFRHLITIPHHSEQGQLCMGIPGGHYTKDVRRRRMNTMYAHDESNWIICCAECFSEAEQYWAEQWEDYYSMVL